MSRKYTAEEMRDMALNIIMSEDDWIEDAAAMLCQAADEMEREKKYEYAVRWTDGSISCNSNNIKDALDAESGINADGLIICHAVRREVCEWEEVE